MDGTSDKGFSRFHRFLSRGAWSGLTGSRILLGLLLKAFVPDGQPLVIGVDDTIERRRGSKIRDKGIYRDPVRSSRGFFVKVEGLRWLSLQVLARPGFATRTWGLPFLTVLCRSERANAKRRRRHQTVPEKAAWGMRLIARWLPHRRLVMVGDGAFASLAVFRTLKDRAVCVAGYGDGGPGYIPTARAYLEGGYEPTVALAAPCEELLTRALTKVLDARRR